MATLSKPVTLFLRSWSCTGLLFADLPLFPLSAEYLNEASHMSREGADRTSELRSFAFALLRCLHFVLSSLAFDTQSLLRFALLRSSFGLGKEANN